MHLNSTLETYLHQHIPISNAMGIKVDTVSREKVILQAPFNQNINHKKTVFGGSLHAVATLSCWSLLHINLSVLLKKSVQIVISSSQVDYLAPVTQDFQAECCLPDNESWEYFLKMLARKNKARIDLKAKIFQKERLCVDYSGTFVALKDEESSK